MTIGEFKAFLEGMGVDGAPTPEQWARIKEKIDGLEAFRVGGIPDYVSPYPSTTPLLTYDTPPYTTCVSNVTGCVPASSYIDPMAGKAMGHWTQ